MKQFILPDSNYDSSVLKTIRMKTTTLNRIEELSRSSNLSINRIINECIEYALDNLKVSEKEKVHK